ncbi:MAG: hypothetical protein BZ135_05590 [Methanosphaera sp. rholeuAM6]|nr:MAG: hypothetical protein BZ135_05590 [Methanosphaera sp. rholeuAM6]
MLEYSIWIPRDNEEWILSFKSLEGDSNALPDKIMIFTLGKDNLLETYVLKSDSRGIISLSLNLNEGDYAESCSFAENSRYNSYTHENIFLLV